MSDTWAWDGQDWVQLSDTGPSARQSHAVACDFSRSRVALFSGGQISAQAANVAAADTWEWNGVDWAQVADTGPIARLGAKLAYVQGGVLLFGGVGDAAGPAPGDTWKWDGHQWLQIADTGPAPRMGHAMTSDDVTVVLFGGQRLAAADTRVVNDTWAWYDQTWRQIQDIGPSPRSGHAMANVTGDDGDHTTLYGGEGSEQFGDTWRLEDRS
jgi:N-acetylneuraminic acid mutarotase